MDLSKDYLDDYTPQDVVNSYFDMHERHDVIAKFIVETLEAFYEKNIINGPKPAFEHLVDVGCGSGRQTVEFQSYFSRITAIDISEAQITMAEKVYSKKSNISFATGCAENIPVDDASADVIISVFGAHFFNMEKFTKECLRVLKPHGVAVLFGDRSARIVAASEFKIDKNFILDSAELWSTSYSNLAQHAAEVNHPEWHLYNRFQKLYDDIQTMSKSRDDSKKFDMDMSLLELKKYFFAIPFNCLPKPKSIFEDFWSKLKDQWQVQHLEDDDVTVNRINEAFIVTLSK